MSGQVCPCCSPYAEAERAFESHYAYCETCADMKDGAIITEIRCTEGERLQECMREELCRR